MRKDVTQTAPAAQTAPAKSPLKVIVAVLAVVVVLVFASAVFRILDSSQDFTIQYDARDYLYDAERGMYGSLYETAVMDPGAKGSYSTDVAEYRALALYYEQAVLQHAYRTCGDDAKADAFAERMTECEAQLGSLASKAASVRETVGE